MGNRENFCATPLFAKSPTTAQIQAMSEELEKVGKASILVATLKGNSYNPCNFFETSCNKKNNGVAVIGPSASNTLVRPDIFSSMLSEIDLSNLFVELASEIESKVGLSIQEARYIESETRAQSQSQIWHFERSRRLTASIFGHVLNRRQSIYPKSISDAFARSRDGRKIATTAPMQWGKENEKVALQCYEEQMSSDCCISDSSLVINPRWPWLGASPDGLVVQDGEIVGAVEIKCPYCKRDMLISEACTEKSFFLEMKSSIPSLKEKHAYYYQCQGVMNILGLKWLDFIVYTKKDLYWERIDCDQKLWTHKMLPGLTYFFTEFILPGL